MWWHTRAETRFRLSAKRTSTFKPAGASVQSTTGSRGVRISGSNAGYTMSRGSVMSTGYPLQSSVFPSLPLPCVTVCHHISTGLYYDFFPKHIGASSVCRWSWRPPNMVDSYKYVYIPHTRHLKILIASYLQLKTPLSSERKLLDCKRLNFKTILILGHDPERSLDTNTHIHS
jgi:hypothetical protein